MTTLEAREMTRSLAREKLKDHVALIAGGTPAVGTAIGRSLASRLGGGTGSSSGLCPVRDSCSLITGGVLMLNGSQD